MSELRAKNPNSAVYWSPRIQAIQPTLQVNVPDTRIIPFEFTEAFPLLEGTVPDDLPWGEFVEYAEDIGWPVFVRSDQKSVKHAGPSAYRADEPDDIPTCLATITDHHVKSMRRPGALMLREWIDINAQFRAFDGLKIGRELRVFADGEAVQCSHFYWPRDAIDEGRNTPTTLDGSEELDKGDWQDRLDHLRHIPEKSHLYEAATTIVESLNGTDFVDVGTVWSVDFVEDVDGHWWVLDVAVGEDSWHPECEEVSPHA